jgi:hypothetical protein
MYFEFVVHIMEGPLDRKRLANKFMEFVAGSRSRCTCGKPTMLFAAGPSRSYSTGMEPDSSTGASKNLPVTTTWSSDDRCTSFTKVRR